MFIKLEITIVCIQKLINIGTGLSVTCCGWQRVGIGLYLYPYRTSALDEGGLSPPYLDHFTPGKETQYPLWRKLGGLQDQFGWV